MKPALRKNFVEEEIKRVAINMDTKNQNDPWVVAKDWLKPRSVYPAKHQALGSILHALTTTKVNLINYTFYRILIVIYIQILADQVDTTIEIILKLKLIMINRFLKKFQLYRNTTL